MTTLAAFRAGSLADRPDQGRLDASTVPLVLLHAFPLDSTMFHAVLPSLSDLPLVLVDLPTQGQSPSLGTATVSAAADAVAETFTQLNVERAVVAGVSMGGYVTMALMRHYPERLAGVVLMHTKDSADTPKAAEARLEMARQVLAESSPAAAIGMAAKMVHRPELHEWVRQAIGRAKPAGIAWAQRAMATRPDSFNTLRACAIPGTVVAGLADQLIPVAAAEDMAHALGRNGSLVLLDQVGHLSPIEVPELTAALLRQAYNRAVGQRPGLAR